MHKPQILPYCQRCESTCVQQSRPCGSLEYFFYLLGIYPTECQVCGCRNMVYPPGVRHPVQDLNRRDNARLEVYMPITFAGAGGQGEGVAVNLSTGGCKLWTTAVFPVGTSLRLQMSQEPDACPLVIERAIVRWVQDGTVGIQFVQMLESECLRLRQLVHLLKTAHTGVGSLTLCHSASWTAREEEVYDPHDCVV